jgi:hypothetical protein
MNIKGSDICKIPKNILGKYMQDYTLEVNLCILYAVCFLDFAVHWCLYLKIDAANLELKMFHNIGN